MAHMAARIASGLAAAGVATLLSVAPAQAMVLPDPPTCGTSGCIAPTPPPPEPTRWLTIGLGAAGGVAVAGAAAATVSSRSRRQQHTPASRTPVAG